NGISTMPPSSARPCRSTIRITSPSSSTITAGGRRSHDAKRSTTLWKPGSPPDRSFRPPRSPWKATPTARRIRRPAPIAQNSPANTTTASSPAASATIFHRKHRPHSPRRSSTWITPDAREEPSMSDVQVEQKNYRMPPQDGITIAHFITVADIERSAQFYEKIFGGKILSRGDSSGAPGYIQIANTWLIVNVGGGPTPDKPTVTLSIPPDPDAVSSFMNIRVADIHACYDLWRSRGAEFITEPKDKYGETRCYIRDPDGYIIEVGQSKPDFTYG